MITHHPRNSDRNCIPIIFLLLSIKIIAVFMCVFDVRFNNHHFLCVRKNVIHSLSELFSLIDWINYENKAHSLDANCFWHFLNKIQIWRTINMINILDVLSIPLGSFLTHSIILSLILSLTHYISLSLFHHSHT